jgi:acyl dehydratase
MIFYDIVKDWQFGELQHGYGERELILYALAAGLGADPVHPRALRFVQERGLLALPTFATVVGAPGAWWRDPRTGADGLRLVHGEQHLQVFRPLPTQGPLLARNRVHSLTDKGAGRGAVGVVLRDIIDPADGAIVARSTNVSVLRGDGGFSEADGRSDPPPQPLPAVPDRAPDCTVAARTRPESALLYRLTGDMNPIHSDPQVAHAAGFPRPILHGLCTYAMACHAVLRQLLDYDPARLAGLAVRFTAPVLPGDTLDFELWRESATRWRLRGRVAERNLTVIDNGIVELTEA